MFLLIDNYDSFTYNLVQAFYALGLNPIVRKNDDPEILKLAKDPQLELVCISPGPGHPAEAGLCSQFLDNLNPQIPVLGVCLGHQILGLYGGGKISIAPLINHGKQSEITHNKEGIFEELSNPLLVGRYHSLIVEQTPQSQKVFTVTAYGPLGEAMALQYKDRPWVGLQFHPESILTPDGLSILANFPKMAGKKIKAKISQIIDTLALGKDLNEETAAQGFELLMDGKLTAAQAGAFLMGLRMKGETPLELDQAVKTVLARAVPVKSPSGKAIDIVGAGGDYKHTFNCSTAASLIMAGMGYKVVKHGNRAVSSTCGAGDILELLNFPIESDPEKAMSHADKCNFTFLFAPYFHPSFKNIGPTRKELGVRTLFNILGPMLNPSRPSYLLMGVPQAELVQIVAQTLAKSHWKKAAVIWGSGGYDEITAFGPAKIALIENGNVTEIDFDPARYGFTPGNPDELTVKNKEEALDTIKNILNNTAPKAQMDMVLLNLAFAIWLIEDSMTIEEAIKKGRGGMENKAGLRILQYVG